MTNNNLISYLINKAFVNANDVITGDFIFHQIISRNSIFKVALGKGNGLFIKQLQNMSAHEIYWMQKDATTHYLFHKSECYRETQKYIPKYHGYDPLSHVLVLDFFKEATDLYNLVTKYQVLSHQHAEQIADIFISFHKDIEEEIVNNKSLQFYNREVPFILRLPEFADKQNPKEKIFEIIKNDEILREGLSQLYMEWKGNSLIHGDIKLANFLVTNQGHYEEVKLIDWETSNIGDPLWDVAGLVQSYLSISIFSQYLNLNELDTDGKKEISLVEYKSVLRTFWKRYSNYYAWNEELENVQMKIMRFTAARLLQTAKEFNPNNSDDLVSGTIQIIDLARTIFKDPEVAVHNYLSGIK
ncbi:phosphotransferase [Olleya sp. HaHaR_3_96]|uniref:phosphotransferase n=1 Tax=Olleya sp. HaHaR_3_96 TaxID=2745560 RepID=UPI001C4E34A6|nr:phosphotransferase [Olleya sp. HaHaR_3_96]QXP58986.1 aminoglycoside phosphotransferase family protein [Olleya sp. HaHaR_3_96]